MTVGDPGAGVPDGIAIVDATGAPRNTEGWVGRGLARRVVTMGRTRPFQDGGGMCSPGRWSKEQRRLPGEPGRTGFRVLKQLMKDYWAKKSGGRFDLLGFILRLAAGHFTECPFGPDFIKEALDAMAKAFGLGEPDLEIAPGQCFRLRALAGVLRALGDPDWDFPLTLVDGVAIGVGVELPRAPWLYEAKVKWALEDDVAEPNRDRSNYW